MRSGPICKSELLRTSVSTRSVVPCWPRWPRALSLPHLLHLPPGPDAALTAPEQQQQQQQRSKAERCRPLGAGHTEARSTRDALYSERGHHALGEMEKRGGGAELARAGAPISPARAAGSRAASLEGLARRRPRGGRAAGGVTAAPAPRSAWSALANSLFQLKLRGWTAPPVPREPGSTSRPGLAQVSQHQPKDSSRSLLAPEG